MQALELRSRWRTVQWERAVRAAIAVGSAMIVCHTLGRSPGAAALGAFDALLVDNGGPAPPREGAGAQAWAGGGVPDAVPTGAGSGDAAGGLLCNYLCAGAVAAAGFVGCADPGAVL